MGKYHYAAPGQKSDGNWRTCIGQDCETQVYWRDGEYCWVCRELPERRCADCGQTSRPGKAEYVPAETIAPEWTEFVSVEVRPMRAPKAIKPHTVQSRYIPTGTLRCRHCDSTNIARLTFGIDRLPMEQQTCAAWPTLANQDGAGSPPSAGLNKSLDDSRIRWKTCVSCGERLYGRFKAGVSRKWQRSEDGYFPAVREARASLPDGKWTTSPKHLVHQECPDPPIVAHERVNEYTGRTYREYELVAA